MTSATATRAREHLTMWMPGARIRGASDEATGALLEWQGPLGTVRYLLKFQNHLPQQDIQVLAHRLEGLVRALPKGKTATRALLLAPYVPLKQAEFLRGRGIDYADEVGNAYLNAPGLLVHIEGKRPDAAAAARGGITKGWVRVALAGLLNPALFDGPYHQLATTAGVTPPTVMTCLRDLQRRGLVDARGRRRRLIGRQELVALWTQAYLNTLRPRLPERRFRILRRDESHGGLERLKHVFDARDIAWCLTGAAAALQLTNYYKTDLTEIYAAPLAINDAVARELKAQPTVRDANLVVIEPPIPGIVPEHAPGKILPTAPPLLAYAELRFHATERANDAAELLLPLIEGQNGSTA